MIDSSINFPVTGSNEEEGFRRTLRGTVRSRQGLRVVYVPSASFAFTVAVGLTLLGCVQPVGESAVEPASGSSSGYYPIQIDLAELGVVATEVQGVEVGGIAALQPVALGTSTLEVFVQGAPEPGPAVVVVETAEGVQSLTTPFVYEAPLDPLFERVVAFGASLTQGVQGGVPSYHGALASPAALIARQAGAFMPQPLLVPGLFPSLSAADVGPPPTCAIPDVVGFVSTAASEIIPQLWDDDLQAFAYHRARLDPDLMPRNLAVGSTDLIAVLNGPDEDDFGGNFVASLVYAPYGTFGESVTTSQMDWLEAADPTLVISTDLFGNDLVGSLLEADGIEPDRIVEPSVFQADLTELLDRLVATGAQSVLSTVPQPSLLPATAEKRGRILQDGTQTEAEVDAAIALIDLRADEFNAILRSAAESRPSVHVVDLAARVDELVLSGLSVDGVALGVGKLQGLLGVDGVHFTDTGYAVLANLFIESMAETLAVDLPSVDLADVLASDPASPDALLRAGLDSAECH